MTRSTSWKNLVEAYQVCSQKYARTLNAFGLTPSQLDILIQIELLGDNARPKAIADGLLVTKGNITSVTKRLFERELIRQRPDPADKRSTIFCMTPEGLTVLKDAKKMARKFIDAQLAPFSDQEVQLVGRLMSRMRQHLESDDFDKSLLDVQRTFETYENTL